MKAVKWSSENLIQRVQGVDHILADVVDAVGQGERARITIARASPHRLVGSAVRPHIDRAQFRASCIKAVESSIWSLPEKGSVIAEIHRRLDAIGADDRGNEAKLAAVFDFAAAWSLAATLIRQGLAVRVRESRSAALDGTDKRWRKTDVEILLPTGPAPTG